MDTYSNFSVTEEFKREVIEHGVKIKNIEGIVVETNNKLSQVAEDLQQIRVLIASRPTCDPLACSAHTSQIKSLEIRTKEIEDTTADLVNSKNRLVGAMTLGGVVGSCIGVLGTWITTLMLRTPK